jgi:hypothetical protein
MKIAFLFMIYDTLEKEDLWFNFFNNIDINKYNIYIHAKDNTKIEFKNKFFYKFVIKNNYNTQWGDYSLVYLQNKLLELALIDEMNYKFIILSNTHIPLHNFNFIYNFLIKNNNNYISYEHYTNQSSSLLNRFKTINNYKKYNLNNWYYSSQWSILNRDIVSFILKNEIEFDNIFKNSKFCDEYAYINFLLENKKYSSIINKKTTFISNVASINTQLYRKYPHTFDTNEINLELFNNIKSSYLFMRKISKTCYIDENWIFNDINKFNLTNKKIKLNKESFPNLSKQEYNSIHINKVINNIKKIKIK